VWTGRMPKDLRNLGLPQSRITHVASPCSASNSEVWKRPEWFKVAANDLFSTRKGCRSKFKEMGKKCLKQSVDSVGDRQIRGGNSSRYKDCRLAQLCKLLHHMDSPWALRLPGFRVLKAHSRLLSGWAETRLVSPLDLRLSTPS